MATKNQTQRIETLEQLMVEVLAGQSTMLQSHIQVEARLEAKLDAKLEAFGETFHNQLMELFREQLSGIALGKGKDPIDSPAVHTAIGFSSSSGVGPNRDRNGHPTGRLKLEFPKFNGENPRLWLQKCLMYFDYNSMTDYDKLSLVAMNLEGPADQWFVDYVRDKGNLT